MCFVITLSFCFRWWVIWSFVLRFHNVSEISLLERLPNAELVKKSFFILKPKMSVTCSTGLERLCFFLFAPLIKSGKQMYNVKIRCINRSKIYAHLCHLFHLITLTVTFRSGGWVNGWHESCWSGDKLFLRLQN